MKLQARNFVVRKPETIDITMFFKKFCIATRTTASEASTVQFSPQGGNCTVSALFLMQISYMTLRFRKIRLKAPAPIS